MGDPRLLRVAQPVTGFDGDELHLLITDLIDTMVAANGAGLAAPQIGVDLQVVIFGSGGIQSALSRGTHRAAHCLVQPGDHTPG